MTQPNNSDGPKAQRSLKRPKQLSISETDAKKPAVGGLTSPDLAKLQLPTPDLNNMLKSFNMASQLGANQSFLSTRPIILYQQSLPAAVAQGPSNSTAKSSVISFVKPNVADQTVPDSFAQPQVLYNAQLAVATATQPNARTAVLNGNESAANQPLLDRAYSGTPGISISSFQSQAADGVADAAPIALKTKKVARPLPAAIAQSSLSSGPKCDTSLLGHAPDALLRNGVGRASTIGGCAPTLPVVNYENMEMRKAEQKKERNRIAARNCRQRKLDKISTLSKQVDDYKQQNSSLEQKLRDVQQQIQRLEKAMLAHRQNGCSIITPLGRM